MKTWLGAVACLFLAMHMPALAADAPCRLQRVVGLDMKFSPSGSPLIPATIGGKELSLLVDTGSPFTLLRESRAREMGLRLEPLPPQSFFMFDGTPIRYMTHASGFMLGRVPLANFNFLVAPDNQLPEGEDGLFGADTLSRLDVDFDFGQMKLNLLNPNQCGDGVVYWANAYAQLPVTFGDALVAANGSRMEATHIYARARLDDKEVKILIDTGSSVSAMTMAQARHFFGWSEPPANLLKLSGTAEQARYLLPVKNLSLGPIAISNPKLVILDVKGAIVDQDYDMLLGMDVLRLFHLYISYGQKIVYFTPNPEKAKPAQ